MSGVNRLAVCCLTSSTDFRKEKSEPMNTLGWFASCIDLPVRPSYDPRNSYTFLSERICAPQESYRLPRRVSARTFLSGKDEWFGRYNESCEKPSVFSLCSPSCWCLGLCCDR